MTYSSYVWPTGIYYFEQPWTLDGTTYVLTMRYNLRAQCWYMDVADATGSAIVCGIPLLATRDLLKQYSAYNVPKGLMFVFDPSGQNATPGMDDFSVNHRLMYLSTQ